MVKKRGGYAKWILIAFVLYCVWKCIKTDREKFTSSTTTQEDFGSNIGNLEPKCNGEPVVSSGGSCNSCS